MLYLIVPPIIIIIASIILLFLFSRKGDEFIKKEEEIQRVNILKNNMIRKNSDIAFSRVKHFSFSMLEKSTSLFKSLLLKFHDTTGRWSNIIKEKKSKYAAGFKKQASEIKNEEVIIEESVFIAKAEAPIAQEIAKQEKKPFPIVREELVQPETKKEATKEEFEKILIERIAGNPRDLEAYERLGAYYLEQKNYVDAKECYKQVLKLSPINRQARIKLNKIIRMLGR